MLFPRLVDSGLLRFVFIFFSLIEGVDSYSNGRYSFISASSPRLHIPSKFNRFPFDHRDSIVYYNLNGIKRSFGLRVSRFEDRGDLVGDPDNKYMSIHPFPPQDGHQGVNSDVMIDEFGLRIPQFHPNPEKVKSQLMYYGPDIPGELWKAPERPVGFFATKRVAPDGFAMPAKKAIVISARKKKYLRVIYFHVRRLYKKYIKESRTYGELMYWKYKLDALPKNSSPVRYHNYCPVSGRFRAYYGFFGLGRHVLREFVNMGCVPGVRPANW